jgi:hypothetical protein
VRLLDDGGALAAGVVDAAVDVGHLERDVDDAVAVAPVVVEQRAGRVDTALDDELDRPGTQHIGLVVAVAGLRARVRDQLRAVDRLLEQGALGGVADRPHKGVPSGDGERVGLRVVLHEPDELPQCREVQICEALLAGEGLFDGHVLISLRRRWDQTPITPAP